MCCAARAHAHASELYTFAMMSGHLDASSITRRRSSISSSFGTQTRKDDDDTNSTEDARIQFLPLTQGDENLAASIGGRFLEFDAGQAQCWDPAERDHLLTIVENGGGDGMFNHIVRSMHPYYVSATEVSVC